MNNKKLKQKKERIWELDFIRAICVLLMVFDHTMYNLGFNFGLSWIAKNPTNDVLREVVFNARKYWGSDIRTFVQPLVVCLFAFLCGISTSFSRSNFKRFVEVAICAGLISLVMHFLEMPLPFGILHVLALSILLWWLINLICQKNKIATSIVCLVVGLGIIISNKFLMDIYIENNNAFATDNTWAWVGEFLYGDIHSEFSADYQTIFPTTGYVLLGGAVAPWIYPKKKSLLPWLGKYDWYTPINIWGKIALPVYVFHQLIIGAIFALLSYFIFTKGSFVIF